MERTMKLRIMKNTAIPTLVASLVLGLLPAAVSAYQATGPILELTDKKIVIQKGNEKWEFARGSETKVDGTLKVGERVTVYYTMSATRIEAKSEAPPAEAKPPLKKAG